MDTAVATNCYIVRHGATRLLGDFIAPDEKLFSRGNRVILKTERGLEIGDILCPATPEAVRHITDPTRGQILRAMSAEDRGKAEDNLALAKRQFTIASDIVEHRQLAMQLVDVERLFGGERLIFYFLSEKRIDFRDLVKELAREFQIRIELRQIGVRDEAKLKADYGDCGKPVCCNTHLTQMPPVSMKMAKLQKSTLDPSKISGRCGRLKCCLRYEQDVYEEFQRELPPVNSQIVTRIGQGRVVAQEILSRRVVVVMQDGRRIPVAADDVLTRIEPPQRPGRGT
jgi:cell fate regulator YaaT (PSP1 superfamily)